MQSIDDLSAQIEKQQQVLKFVVARLEAVEQDQRPSTNGISIKDYAKKSGFPIHTIRYWIKTHWKEGLEYARIGGRILVHPLAIERSLGWA